MALKYNRESSFCQRFCGSKKLERHELVMDNLPSFKPASEPSNIIWDDLEIRGSKLFVR